MADRAMRAVGWSFVSSALGKLATVVIGVMLARMLSPSDFGVYAVAYAALRVLVSLNDLGLSLAIVRWPGDPREVAPTVASMAVLVSLVMYGACWLGAPAYATAMGAPAAAGVVRVLCFGVVLDGFVSSPAGLLQRQFRQDLRLVTDQVNLWLGTIITVVLAWRGYGAMSLGIGRVAGCVASLILLIKFSPEPLRFGLSLRRVRDVLRFGLPVAASTIISFCVVNADQVVVGRMLGVTALGYFVLAANLSSWPVAVFAQPVRNVALAGFARLQHDPPAMRRAFFLVAGLLTAVALPVCLMMTGAAVPLVGFVYGDRWLAAAPVLGWLGVLAGLQIAFELGYDYFVVLARPRVIFTLQLVWLIALVPALAGGALGGSATRVAQAEIAVAAGLVLPWYLWELRTTGIRVSTLARRLRLPATGAVAAGLACWGAGRLIPFHPGSLLLGGTIGSVIIMLLVQRLRPALAVLRRRTAEPPAPPGPDEQVTAEVPVVRPGAAAAAGAPDLASLVPDPPAPADPVADSPALAAPGGRSQPLATPSISHRNGDGPQPGHRAHGDSQPPGHWATGDDRVQEYWPNGDDGGREYWANGDDGRQEYWANEDGPRPGCEANGEGPQPVSWANGDGQPPEYAPSGDEPWAGHPDIGEAPWQEYQATGDGAWHGSWANGDAPRPGHGHPPVAVPPPPDPSPPPPLFRATAAALGWEPAEPGCPEAAEGQDPPPF